MDVTLILLRIIHIFGGVFWVGAALVSTFFLGPAVASSGLEGQKFMQNLMVRRRFQTAIGIGATLTILAGALLYLRDSGGLQLRWITSNVGLGFTIGAVAALAGFLEGGIVLGPTGEKLGKLSATIQTQGKLPTPEQQAELAKLSAKINSGGLLSTVLLTIALLAIATARYW